MSWVQQQPPPPPPPSASASASASAQHAQNGAYAPLANPSMRTQNYGANALSFTSPQQQQQIQQSHFNNQQSKQSQTWQQQNYLQLNNTMPQNTTGNNWQQQTLTNANVYQQHQKPTTTAGTGLDSKRPNHQQQQQQQQQVPQHQQHMQTPTTFGNYYMQPPQQQQQQHQTNYQQQNDNAAFYQQLQQQPQQQPQQQQPQLQQLVPQQQQPQQQDQQQQSQSLDFFDSRNNVNKSDGWGDWDWNDNSNMATTDLQQHQTSEQQQQTAYNANVIEDSFSNHVNENSWHWGLPEDSNANVNMNQAEQQSKNTPSSATTNVANTFIPQVPTQLSEQPQIHENGIQPQQPQQQSQLQAQVLGEYPVPTSQKSDNMQISTPNIFEANVIAKPTTLPLPESTNENYNISAAPPTGASSIATPGNNIPNSVYVSQAKPVSRPSRQYASPPNATTPVETPEKSIAPPPLGFQNDSLKLDASSTVTQPSPAVPSILPISQAPPAVLPPPANVNIGSNSNPFKRTGVAQHHRADLGPVNTQNSTQLPPSPLMLPNAFAVPPPPADFANPIPALNDNHLVPDNSEILHENQEVIVTPGSVQTISLPGSVSTSLTSPSNDERNQYLRTSHLSENPDDELNLEGDSLPPPGLSRLVLGQPELTASQRMVTGTEEPTNIAANMHIEERHADGEDTSVEQVLPTATINQPIRGILSANGTVGAPSHSPNNLDITTNRNLYLVAGESNGVNDQRVVTGVETAVEAVAITTISTQIINEQREIELDGENLEDQQPITSVCRNEPPLEGAASITEISAPIPPVEHVEQHHHHSQAKTKDLSNVSTGNDDSDQLQERHAHTRYANKTRKYAAEPDKKIEKQRKEKQRSIDRFESEESEEYSSERERDRERRRGYREGSVRSDRGRDEREYNTDRRRREKYESSGIEREKNRDKYYHRATDGAKPERRSQRFHRYEADSSKYETEESTRHEGNRKDRRGVHGPPSDDRSDRDYDEYQRRYRGSKRDKGDTERERRGHGDEERRDHRHRRDRERERGEYDTIERRRRDNYRQRAGERVDPREYDEYRKQSSRNARESDLEKERGRGTDIRYDPRNAAMYGYPMSAYGYDSYSYYKQAVSEWYKKYYDQAAAVAAAATLEGHGQAPEQITTNNMASADGRESVHSGQSSAQNEKERSCNLSAREADSVEPDPQRLTPCKFVNEHAVVSLSAGILVTVKPKYTSHGNLSNIVKLQLLSVNDGTRQLFHAFPGPLVHGLTHKKTVIEFCEEQIRLGPNESTIYAKQLTVNNVEKYKASYTLMWNLLILLLRQNGMVVGTDIAELLLKNQQQFPYQPIGSSTSKSVCETPDENKNAEKCNNDVEDDQTTDADVPGEQVLTPIPQSEANHISQSINSSTLTEEEVTEKFRNFLLYGNVNEALDWAADNNLWGHALFLASKMDRRSHANVMMKFANKLSLNDPLQTLYQLMSGRTPSSVLSVQDEKWGDWRPHLSMILSNTSQKPELDRKAITTLGDSLFNRGDLFAAHFCYLMAQVGFGRYQASATLETTLQQTLPKLVLLGSSHYKNFSDFATNEAIIMTEIYEYACALNDEKFSLIEFQTYKYLLATRLLDYGYHLKSLMYMEQIALHVERDPAKYEPSFIHKVYELADRLKYYDPALEKLVDDQQNLDGNLSGASQNFEEQKWLQSLRILAAQHAIDYSQTSPVTGGYVTDNNYQLQNQIDQQFVEINKQFNELNLQYSNSTMEASYYNPNTMQQQQPQIQQTIDKTDIYQQQQQQQLLTDQHYVPQPLPGSDGAVSAPLDSYANYSQQYLTSEQQQQQQQHLNSYYDPTQAQAQYNSPNPTDVGSAGSGYDYWATQRQPQIGDENARPTITMPKSKTYESDDDAQHKNQQQQLQQQSKGSDNQGKKKNDGKDANKGALQANQNSGWFGGIWNKLSLKPKNQMILPDDKNPTIVWDPEKKRWVNTEGDEQADESLKPPPKMSDLMTHGQQQPQLQLQPQQPPQLQQPQQPQQPQQLQQHQQPQQHQQLQQPQQPQQPQQQQQQQQQQQPPPPPLQQQQQYQQQQSSMFDTHQYVGSGATAGVTPLAPAAMPNNSVPIHNYSAASASSDAVTTAATAPSKTPSLQSNMFKMQRNRTLKNSYVDVFNPSGAPMSKATENVLAPALPPAAVPQGGFFIPGAPLGNDGAANPLKPQSQPQQQQQQQQQSQDIPQFYNPNQFGAGGSTGPGGY